MSGCRPGCEGVPLTSATFECLALENGACGGCAGLPAGFSRVQVNAAGELEICTNVGGVCECAPAGGSSVLVNNGDATFTHTSADGTVTVIDLCNDQIGCQESIEVTEISDVQRYDDFDGDPTTNIPTVAAAGLTPVTAVLTNPSAVRSMVVRFTVSPKRASVVLTSPVGQLLNFAYEIIPLVTVDGALLANPNVNFGATYSGATFLSARTYDLALLPASYSETRVIAPGATITVNYTTTFQPRILHDATDRAQVSLGGATISMHGTLI